MKRYLAVIEVDVWAENDLDAATQAVKAIKALEGPQVHVLALDDDLEPWVGVDFNDIDDDGQPYMGEAKPLCFDFVP